MIAFKRHTFFALTFFFIAAFMGLLLRSSHVFAIDFQYRYVVHAHSHVALMGWVHFALMTLITYYFLRDSIPKKKYLRIFWFTLISVIGMLLSFPFQGYAVFSIIFSSLFLISTYFYSYQVFKYTPKEDKKKASFKMIRWALIFMIISSFGPWSLGGIMATVGAESHWYHTSIYLYLHFQYNAWIILGVLGIIIKLLENRGEKIDTVLTNKILLSFNLAALLTMFVSVLYVQPPKIYFILSILGSLIQLYTIFLLIKFFRNHLAWFKIEFTKLQRRLINWAFILFISKAVMQLLGSFPDIAKIIAQNTYLAIGFLHLIFLGVITMSILALLEKSSFIRLNNFSIQCYAVGFAFTEAIIFYRPAVKILNFPPSPNYAIFLWAATVILTTGIAIILGRMIRIRFELK